MSPGCWVSARVPALGTITSEGIRNQLGRPPIDRLTVLVRETAQNSWDAGLRDRPVEYRLDVTTLKRKRLAAWRRHLGRGAPPARHLRLMELLEREETVILTISDRNTTGLGGPTRADAPVGDDDVPRDYLNFIFMVGTPRDKHLGGGTYGFGKASLYAASQTGTIAVSTRCLNEHGALESRFICCALGDSYQHGEHAYTGRHWWGVGDPDGEAVEPLRNDEAVAISAELGLPGFSSDERGTSIAIVAAELDGRTPVQVGEHLREAVLWHLWPKMLEQADGRPEMVFSITVDGEPVDMPDPRDHPAIRRFVHAYHAQSDPERSKELWCGSPRKLLGRVAFERVLAPAPVLSDVAREAGLVDGVRHVCLMRAAHLVVKYLPGPETAQPSIWYAGVFKPTEDLDDVFAEAEPPTHDDWVAAQLKGNEKRFVSTTFTRLQKELREVAAPQQPEPAAERQPPLAAASRLLGGLIAGAAGFGADRSGTPRRRGGAGGRKSPVRLAGEPRWERRDGREVLVQDVIVQCTESATIEPSLGIAMWGSDHSEHDPPAGARPVTFLGWEGPDGTVERERSIRFTAADNGTWRILIDPPVDGLTAIGLKRVGKDGDA